MTETAYDVPAPTGGEMPHHYGPRVHILSDAWALSALARLGHPDTGTMAFHRLLESCYRRLLHAITSELPTSHVNVPTRMSGLEPRARYTGAVLDTGHPVVIVDVARAGIIPSLVFQHELLDVLDAAAVRVDHLYMQRTTDDDGHITGVDLSGSKIGGRVDEVTLVIPDPMGATGTSIAHVVDHYCTALGGRPDKIIACHLMVTPEYLERIEAINQDVTVYALRLDRGLSQAKTLASTLGTHRPAERGLTDKGYIVPGAGGLGELVNNAFV